MDGIVKVGLPSAKHVVLAQNCRGFGRCRVAGVDLTDEDFAGVVLEDWEFENLHGSLGLESRDSDDVETETGETGSLIGFDEEVNVDGDLGLGTVVYGSLCDGEGMGVLGSVDDREHRLAIEFDDVTLLGIEGQGEMEVVRGVDECLAILGGWERAGFARDFDGLSELGDGISFGRKTVSVDLWSFDVSRFWGRLVDIAVEGLGGCDEDGERAGSQGEKGGELEETHDSDSSFFLNSKN
ncbi:hypothetical protein AA313_de0209096 [Arthrobotrys entomopaga]|nr:hypothetical protein AA313_de0209096 [Arthrobotrys entomopaga]